MKPGEYVDAVYRVQVDGISGSSVKDALMNLVTLAVIAGIVLLAGYYVACGRQKKH